MTYDDALAFWYGRIDYERRQPRPGDLKLDRMRALLRRLGDPHRRTRCVHVAGTKGKGSTSAMLASVLRKAGYRTGLFTSPHLADIGERMLVNGEPISHDEIACRMGEVAAVVADMDREGDPTWSPTFFEIITALGFLHFDCRRVDVAVLEVGLGGRFDSTNVCEPLVSIITNISLDHMAILGGTLAEIAYQKAGIIRRDVPVVTTAESAEARSVIESEARLHGAPLDRLGDEFQYEAEPGKPFEPGRFRVRTATRDWSWLALGLFGRHQAANASGVIATVERLRRAGLPIAEEAVAAGLRDVAWPARMELVSRRPVVVVDCAHNEASARALVETMAESMPIAGRRTLIFSASTDKQIPEMVAVLAPRFDRVHVTRYQSNPRSADPEVVAELFRKNGLADVRTHATPDGAWGAAKAELRPEDGVVVTGSVFLAGDLRQRVMEDCGAGFQSIDGVR